jgi:hypothetical protein
MAQPSKKATRISSNGGGDKNHPRGKIDSSRKLPVRKKRKNVVEQAEELGIESEDMELETNLDSVFCKVDQPGDAIHHNPLMEIVETEIFDEDESFIFQSSIFYSESKNFNY